MSYREYADLRDIDRIIELVQMRLPSVQVSQQTKIWPADDDGLWWFAMLGVTDSIQIENPFGRCPFLVETDEQCCHNARTANTVDEAVTMIVDHLMTLQVQN